MRYVITAEWDIASDERFEEFKDFVKNTEFDTLILAGDIASQKYTFQIKDWLNDQGCNFIYLNGNTERGKWGGAEIGGWHIEHGHRFDPFFHLPQQLQRNANFLKRAYLSFRGVVKGMYADIVKHKEEAQFVPFGERGKKYAPFLKHLFIQLLSKYLPEKSMLAHFHMFAGESYKVGDKYIVFLEHAPNYASLEDGKLKFHQNP